MSSETIICPNFWCQHPFEPYEGMRKDIKGEYWCKPCQDEHDSIDWEEVAEKRMGM